ncbi:hypothetical protein ACHAPI_002808 [Fusarium lateritium]
MSSTAASDRTGDELADLTAAGGDGQRVVEAFNALKSDTLCTTLSRFHTDFVEINKKKLYVTRTLTSGKDAQAYVKFVTRAIEEKQANPAGQEDAELVDQQDQILSNLKALTPDLITDLYIHFNKAKKETDHPKPGKKSKAKGRSKGKGQQVEASTVSGDEDHSHGSEGDEDHLHDAEGEASSGPSKSKSSGSTTVRQTSNTSHDSGSRRTTRLTSRQISGSSGIDAGASQHSQASATTTERRRSRQRTRFVLSDEENDSDA